VIGTAQGLSSRLREAQAPYDVCVVGAGPAGISLALELEGSGLRVCLLEAGGENYDRASQRLYEGEFEGDRYPPLRDTRLGALGGTSHVWAGWCRPLDAHDFEPGRHAGASGWPFGRDELTPYYRRAQERCGLGIFEYDSAYWQAQLRRPLLLDDDDHIEHAIFHVLPQRFGLRFRASLEDSANIEVMLNAPVARLQVAEDGAVDGVIVQTLDGARACVKARRYVLAAGGIENARLLLLSADSPERALGNEHGLVGRYFTDHPFVNVGALVFDGPPRGLDFYFPQPLAASAGKHVNGAGPPAVRAALTLKRETLATENIGNSALFFHPRYEAHPAFASAEVKAFLELVDKLRHKAVPGGLAPYLGRAIRAPHQVAMAAARKLLVRDAPARRWRIRAMFETESQHSNRVTLGRECDALNRPRARVEWRLSEHDLQSMRRAMRLFDASFRRAGLGRLELGIPDTAEGWRNAAEGGKHHIGTTRMHVDPQLGVVDARGRVHGSPNLYVTGSSVFPSGGYANPTLTIVALAIRLADELRRNFTLE
jgi:choline dehydrogenase-like flavoprotein